MTAPNRSTLWGRVIVDELAASGVSTVCLAPGSRCTPITLAVDAHEDVEAYSHLDERSAAFFALGHAKRTGEPVAVVTTSGTATANLHPAVVEASHARVPIVAVTADRPVELADSGANQTIDQTDLYGDAVRFARTLPEPAPEPRRLRAVRTAVCRAVGASRGTNPGPVHLNVPLPKPLEPTPVDGDVPDDFDETDPVAVEGRDGPFVDVSTGRAELTTGDRRAIDEAIEDASDGLIVCGPAIGAEPTPDALGALARATGFPVVADPLSGHRFGESVRSAAVLGGADAVLAASEGWPSPDVVLRFGASPTSKRVRRYLARTDARSFVVDPAGRWEEAEFAATDLVVADPTVLARSLAEDVGAAAGDRDTTAGDRDTTAGERDTTAGDQDATAEDLDVARGDLAEALHDTEATYWDAVTEFLETEWFEGAIAATVADTMVDPSTLYVSNSMPVRDVDRFVPPDARDLTVLGNRGASGIDGVTSSALGAAAATDEPLVLLTGDLAYYHDMNGLLAVGRADVDATVVVVNNDGGGIFHKLPIEDFDPPFTDLFRTPHGLDFEPTGDLYDLGFERVTELDSLAAAVESSVGTDGTQVVEARVDAEASHRRREVIQERVESRLR